METSVITRDQSVQRSQVPIRLGHQPCEALVSPVATFSRYNDLRPRRGAQGEGTVRAQPGSAPGPFL